MPLPLGQGAPNVDISVVDESLLAVGATKGVCAVLGVTERGELGKPQLVRSWLEFTRFFGGLLSTNKFPLYCKRALERGSPLMVSRLVHYTDPADIATFAGTVATAALTWSSPAGTLDISAKNVGSWGNGVTVTITASPLLANTVNVTVELANYPALKQVIALANAPTTGQIDAFNEAARFITITATSGTIQPQAATALTTGTDDYTGLILADWEGDSTAKTGLHSFDDIYLPVRYALPTNEDANINEVLVDYVVTRGDARAIVRTPEQITGFDAVDYRNGTGAYAGNPVIDTFFASMIFGDIKIKEPLTGLNAYIHYIGDCLGQMGARDIKGKPWFSVGQTRFAKVDTLGIFHNLGAAARADEADLVNQNGINSIIDEGDGAQFAGDWSLQKADTKLRDGNVADLVIELIRQFKGILRPYRYQPNAPQTWQKINRDLAGYLQSVVNEQGIYENGFKIVDDSKVTDVANVQVNTPDDIDAGIYRIFVYIKPIGALKYIGLQMTVTNSSVQYEFLGEVA